MALGDPCLTPLRDDIWDTFEVFEKWTSYDVFNDFGLGHLPEFYEFVDKMKSLGRRHWEAIQLTLQSSEVYISVLQNIERILEVPDLVLVARGVDSQGKAVKEAGEKCRQAANSFASVFKAIHNMQSEVPIIPSLIERSAKLRRSCRRYVVGSKIAQECATYIVQVGQFGQPIAALASPTTAAALPLLCPLVSRVATAVERRQADKASEKGKKLVTLEGTIDLLGKLFERGLQLGENIQVLEKMGKSVESLIESLRHRISKEIDRQGGQAQVCQDNVTWIEAKRRSARLSQMYEYYVFEIERLEDLYPRAYVAESDSTKIVSAAEAIILLSRSIKEAETQTSALEAHIRQVVRDKHQSFCGELLSNVIASFHKKRDEHEPLLREGNSKCRGSSSILCSSGSSRQGCHSAMLDHIAPLKEALHHGTSWRKTVRMNRLHKEATCAQRDLHLRGSLTPIKSALPPENWQATLQSLETHLNTISKLWDFLEEHSHGKVEEMQLKKGV